MKQYFISYVVHYKGERDFYHDVIKFHKEIDCEEDLKYIADDLASTCLTYSRIAIINWKAL